MTKNYSILDDQELITYLKKDDHLAFNEIYKRFWKISINAAYQRLDSKEMAEEVVQDVFVNLYIKREIIQVKNSLEAYIRTAIKNRIIDVFRLQKLKERYQQEDPIKFENNPSQPDQIIQYKELRTKIKLATDRMPDKCREVFLLSRFENLSHKEIADRVGISVSTVKKHINKALKILNEDFNDVNLDILIVCLYIYLQS